MRRQLVAGTTLAVAILGATAPAFAAKHPKPKPITRVQAAHQYLADVKPLNLEVNRFDTAIQAWVKADGTAAQSVKFTRPFIAATRAFDHKLLEQRWPPNTVADVHAVVTDDSAVVGDLAALQSQNILSIGQWAATFGRDTNKLGAASGIVRSDLGLPQIK